MGLKMHSFYVDAAVKYGMLESVLLSSIAYWVEHNEANEKNFHDGRYWTFNSTKAFKSLFPYASEKQIRKALDHLKDEGLIVTGNFNQLPYDRTLWYSITEKGECICPTGQMEVPKKENGNPPQGEPIPVLTSSLPIQESSNEDSYTVPPSKKSKWREPTVEEVRAYCQERNNGIDAEYFIDYYKSNGWMVGKKHMVDWKASVRTWERNNYNSGRNNQSQGTTNPFLRLLEEGAFDD